MCRINGFWDFSNQSLDVGEVICKRMRDTMSYAGPDAAGLFSDDNQSLFLGHRRLAILDLSDAGIQPMQYKNTILVFNGEVYNFQEIRKDLEKTGRQFNTQTDTEVILQAWDEWGYDSIHRFRGMFAFAIWDIQKQKLSLCRDRMGVKPLYWYWKDGLFFFASELKSFHEHPGFDKTLNPKAISLFLQQGFIQSPHCIFEYAHKIPPGSFLEINKNQDIRQWDYWNPKAVYQQSQIDDRQQEEIQKDLESLLTESFQLRMVADVPVGLFLSGGVDSSLLTAILQKESDRPLKTFTVGVKDPNYDEAPYAKAVSDHLGTEHTELYNLIELVPQLSDFCDEPLGDTSIFPTHLVAKLAKEDVKVSLSADGGDELFGGYVRHEVAYNQFPNLQKIPKGGKNIMRSLLGKVDPDWLEEKKGYIPVLRKYNQLPHKIHKLRQILNADHLLDFFLASGAYNDRETLAPLQAGFYERYNITEAPIRDRQVLSLLGLIDIQTYLEGNILSKVDRATMQVALEARDPFLDHRIVEFAFGVPDEMKIQGKSTKHILRKILYQYVPQELIDRPKRGFTIPMHNWLRVYFKKDLLELIEDQSFAKTFFLNREYIKTLVQSFLDKRRFVDHHLIWFLFVLFKWQKKWLT